MRFALLSILAIALLSGAVAQTHEARAKKSDEILEKVKELDLLNHILPLLLTNDQLKKLLPAVEKARENVRQTQTKEYQLLISFEKRINDAHSAAMDKGAVPSRELITEVINSFRAMNLIRMAVAEENTEEVLKALKATLNEGQLKAAANALNPKLFNPNLKVEEMTQDDKLKFFVNEILLDPVSYDVLVKLSRSKFLGTGGGG